MLILPAIDLREGRVVRLLRGDFAQETAYGDDPFGQAQSFAQAGAQWLHLVDLDGAKAGSPQQTDLVARIAHTTPLKIQAGGGVRTLAHVETLLGAGVARVVVGSVAATDPDTVAAWTQRLGPDRLTIALDVATSGAEPEVVMHGWTEGTGRSLWNALGTLPEGAHILVTDVARDGAMTGPNLELMGQIRRRRPDLELQASGGVRSAADLEALAQTGVAAAIVGRAIYEGHLGLEELFAAR